MQSFIIIKIFLLTTLTFIFTIIWTPLLTYFLYKYKLGKQIRSSERTPVFSALHQKKSGTPVMGGILVWGTTLIFSLLFFYLAKLFSEYNFIVELNFLTRSQTLLPLGALVASALIGLLDDIYNIKQKGKYGVGFDIGLQVVLYMCIAIVAAWWFYFKLDWDLIRIPFVGNFQIGWWYIPLFIFIIIATSFSVNETDGLDGLAGGTLLASFAAFGAIAFSQGRYDLATFCGVIIGALLAFLWFNIYPARFFMGATGSMSLGVTLGIIAMLTNSVLLLPIIGFIFVVESLSVIVQVVSKKIWKKKIFHSTPIHHHFEAIGWPEPKIVMRFWVIAAMMAVIGLIISLLDKGF